ncbi:MAG: hypothetical protein ACRDRA_01135 [Pseudonocardiaceae bacterium]
MAAERNGVDSMGSYSGVEFSAWVKIGDNATIDYHVFDDGLVEFHVGGRNGFELAATEAGLGNLVDCAQEALHAARTAIARAEERCRTV